MAEWPVALFKVDDNIRRADVLLKSAIKPGEAIQAALDSAVRVGLPEKGPRGGAIWPAAYFVRRVAWHVLDHAWELEDRSINGA